MTDQDVRERAAEALMTLAETRDFDAITLRDVAEAAGLRLSDLRGAFDDVLDVLATFTRMIDRRVLDGTAEDMDDEPARERLFDVAMRRFDHLKPYRPALRRLVRGLARDPLALARWRRTAVASSGWMLTAARIDTGGLAGRMRAQGLAFALARTFRVFLRDDDPGLSRTMAELDRRLREGERWLGGLARLGRTLRGRRRRRPAGGERDAREGEGMPA